MSLSGSSAMRLAAALALGSCSPTAMPQIAVADLCSLHSMPGVEVHVLGRPSTAHLIAYRGEVDRGASCDGHTCCGTAQYVYAVECSFGTIAIIPADETGRLGSATLVCDGGWDGTLQSASCPPSCPGPSCGLLLNLHGFEGRLDAMPRQLPTPETSGPIYGFLVDHLNPQTLVLFDCGAQSDAAR